MLLCPLSLGFHRIGLCAQRYFSVHYFNMSRHEAHHQRLSRATWQWVPAVSLPSPSLTRPSEVTNKVLGEDVDNVTMQPCSCAQSSDCHVALTQKLTWMKLSFLLILPSLFPLSLLEIQMAFFHSGYCNICPKLISASRKQTSGHSTTSLASRRGV